MKEGKREIVLGVMLLAAAMVSALLCTLSGSVDSVLYKVGEALIVVGMTVCSMYLYFNKGKLLVRLTEAAVYMAAVSFLGFKIYRMAGELNTFAFIIITQLTALIIVGIHALISRIINKKTDRQTKESE